MGKLIIKTLPNNRLLILEAITSKGHSTVGRTEIYQLKNESPYVTIIKEKLTLKKLGYEFINGFLQTKEEYTNGFRKILWKRVGQDQKKKLPSVLEKNIYKLRKFILRICEKYLQLLMHLRMIT